MSSRFGWPAIEMLEKRWLLSATLAAPLATTGSDYPAAVWTPAGSDDYSTASSDPRWIIIHTTESTAQSTINEFTTPGNEVSANYMVARNGTVYQFVHDDQVAWDTGNHIYNVDSVGIEHERYTSNGKQYNATEAEYEASALLVRWLANQYSAVPIPLTHYAGSATPETPASVAPADPTDGSGIIGHYQVPDPNNPTLGGGADHHTDPVNWQWDHYMALINTSTAAQTPSNISPPDGASVSTSSITLSASSFSDSLPGVFTSSTARQTPITQIASQWIITNNLTGATVYDSGADSADLSSITLSTSILSNGGSYSWQVRYQNDYGDWSDYSAPTNFTTAPATLSLSGAALYLRVDSSGQTLDVWNNTTAAGSPAQQIPLAVISKIIVSGDSAGSNITLDFANGNLSPGQRITVLGSGTLSNNVLKIVGSAGGNDAISGPAGGLMLNGTYIPSSDYGLIQFTPGAGDDSLSLTGGTLVLGAAGTQPLQLSNLNVTGNGTLDIGDNTIVIPYTAGNDPTPGIESSIASAYSNGAWTGAGITSSLVMDDSDHTSAVGYFDDGSQVKVRATWIGDTNCNGTIDADDLSLMVLGQKQGTTGWSSGNFNFDQKVNADDWMTFALVAGYSAGRDYSQVFAPAAIALGPMQSNDLLDSPAKVLS